jgi:hypothetical protein
MNFTSSKMQNRFQEHFAATDGRCVEEREVHALVAVHANYYELEGPNCPEIHEVMWHLLLPKLRLEVRRWIQKPTSVVTAAGLNLKDDLAQFLGEK